MQQTVNKEEETSAAVTDMDVVVGVDDDDGDESADCILEDVLLLDSVDGIDEDTTDASHEAEITDIAEAEICDVAEPTGINVLLIMYQIILLVHFSTLELGLMEFMF